MDVPILPTGGLEHNAEAWYPSALSILLVLQRCAHIPASDRKPADVVAFRIIGSVPPATDEGLGGCAKAVYWASFTPVDRCKCLYTLPLHLPNSIYNPFFLLLPL